MFLFGLTECRNICPSKTAKFAPWANQHGLLLLRETTDGRLHEWLDRRRARRIRVSL